MKTRLVVAALVFLTFAAAAWAQGPVVNIGGTPGVTPARTVFYSSLTRGTTDRWSKDSVYVVSGLYYVDSLSTLTIDSGTVVLLDSVSAGTLIAYRGKSGLGGKITAVGTETAPIVFMSRKAPGTRGPGDWGGVIVLGRAPVNQVNPVIEGGLVPGSYGGSDPADDNGTFKYVRIEYPGYRFQLNNEINGLTCGGVGSGTTLEKIQVSYSFDDSYEWFGGTVNAKHLVAFGGTDDEYDTDFGFTGNIQFALGIRDPKLYDPTGESQGFESDNLGCVADKIDYVPFTNAIFSNVTLVGPKRTDGTSYTADQRFRYADMHRRSTALEVYNSAFLGYPGGISFRDSATFQRALTGLLEMRNNSYANDTNFVNALGRFRLLEERANETGTCQYTATLPGGWPGLASWLDARGNTGHKVNRQPSDLSLVDMSNLNNPDPRPTTTSELATAGTYFTGLPSFFSTVSYRGAFDPNLSLNQQWGGFTWTNFNPQYTMVTYTGWNMVGPDLTLDNPDPLQTFTAPRTGTIFVWNEATQGYTPATTLSPGVGYWVKYARPAAVKMLGTPLTSAVTVNVTNPSGGWVLVSAPSAGVNNVTVISGSGTITGSQFIWDARTQGYSPVNLTVSGTNNLQAGQAAWVKVTGACTLQLNP